MNEFAVMPKYEEYKDTNNFWLGEVPSHWNIKKFKYLASVQKGKLPRKLTSLSNGSLPPYLSMDYLRGGLASQFVGDRDAVIVDEGEVLLLWDGSNSGEFIKSRRGVISSTVASIKYKNIDNAFAWYASAVVEKILRSSTIGMGIPHVDGSELKNSILALPPKNEQTAIANFLDQKTAQIDEAITTKEKQIELLKERKQIIVQQAVTQGISYEGQPDLPMKDSGVDWIGEIPDHWEIFANRVLFAERVEPGRDELPLLSVSIHSGVSSEEISEEDNVRGRVKIEDKSKYNAVEPNDIVFNMMRAWQGAIGAVEVFGMVSPAYIIAAPKKKLSGKFFEYQYRCPEFIQQMDRYSKGITDFRKRLYWDGFKQLPTIYPPYEEQLKIVEFINELTVQTESAIALQKQQIEKLKEYKTTLINSAVTGKIKVPEVDSGC